MINDANIIKQNSKKLFPPISKPSDQLSSYSSKRQNTEPIENYLGRP